MIYGECNPLYSLCARSPRKISTDIGEERNPAKQGLKLLGRDAKKWVFPSWILIAVTHSLTRDLLGEIKRVRHACCLRWRKVQFWERARREYKTVEKVHFRVHFYTFPFVSNGQDATFPSNGEARNFPVTIVFPRNNYAMIAFPQNELTFHFFRI